MNFIKKFLSKLLGNVEEAVSETVSETIEEATGITAVGLNSLVEAAKAEVDSSGTLTAEEKVAAKNGIDLIVKRIKTVFPF